MAGEFGLQLRSAIVGDLEKDIREGRDRYFASIEAALRLRLQHLQTGWRRDIEASGLAKAPTLTKTIRLKYWRNSGYDPAGLVYSTFPLLQHAFEKSKVITARNGKYILIPNPDVWPGGRVRRARSSTAGGVGGVTIQAARARFGELTFIPPRNGRAGLIIAKALHSEKTGRFRKLKNSQKAESSPRGLTTIIVFYVVRKARQEKRLRGDVIRRRAEAGFAVEMQRDFDRLLLEAERGPLRIAGPSTL